MLKSFFVSFVIVTMSFDGYNHYTISFFSTFTSLEFFL